MGAYDLSGQVHSVDGNSEQNVKENQVQHNASGEDILVAAVEGDGLAHATAEMPAFEKLLSVPEGHTDLHSGMMMEVSPRAFEGLDEGDVGSKTAAGRKRTFTESTLTEQSLNSVESSRQVCVKRTTGSIPAGDDLLSSILAAIQQQLTYTEDIRHVRKKAPCTLSEISMIRRQHIGDKTFLESEFSGKSAQFASLHSRVYDLGRIKVCPNEVHDASLQTVSEPGLRTQNNENANFPETMVEPDIGSHSEKSSAYLETVGEFYRTFPAAESHDMDDNEGPGKANALEAGGQDLNDEFLTVRVIEPDNIDGDEETSYIKLISI
ncbi:hypothetical protein OROMI_018540 [Orobanche minor]